MTRLSSLLSVLIPGLLAGCDGSVPLGRLEEPPQLSLELLTVRPLLPRPWGLALSPNGRHLVVSDFSDGWIYVLDAETYQPLGDTLVAGEPRGIVIDPRTGIDTVLVAGERPGLTIWSLTTEGLLALIPPFDREWTSFIVRSPTTGEIYATLILSDEGRVVGRLSNDGTLLASYPLQASGRAGLAVTESGEQLLALEDMARPTRLLVLDAHDLALLVAIEVPSWANQVVPLDDVPRALIVGGEVGEPVAAVVDWEQGRVDGVQRLGRNSNRASFDLGRGNTWVRIDARTALVGTTHGILAVNTPTGAVANVAGDYDDGTFVNECCSMVWDAIRRRLLVASSIAPSDEAGRLEVYSVD
ncbi:hypothetical protein BH18GEM1_BH18GEM1_10620 [soil metagenome]